MASIPGGQYTFFTAGQAVNVVTTPDGSHLPLPVPGEFNLELVTSLNGPSDLPTGYQGVALASPDGKTIDLVSGDDGFKVLGGGPHTISAGSGNDTIFGGNGPDLIFGGSGRDLIFGGRSDDTISGGSGPDTIFGGAGRDLITGGNGPDLIYGGKGNDTIQGGSGPDTIYGGGGSDLIIGGGGPETIDGGSGHNQIHVGSGPTLIQDSGAAGHDTVVGFDAALGDRIGFAGENNASINHVVATANENGGNTTITLPDGSTMTLIGITHIDHTFFH
jgi:Ca2+-binding RTX toxin-like protein